MLFGSRRKTAKVSAISIHVHTKMVERVNEYKYLGVVFSSNLTWSSHIEKQLAKINKRLGLLRRIKHLLPKFARLLYFNSLVLSLFDYGDVVWGDKDNVTLMQSLQTLHNKAAKIILDLPLQSSASQARKDLSWLELTERRRYHRCLFVYKCLNNLLATNLHLTKLSEGHSYDTRHGNEFRLPKVKTNWGKQQLIYQAIKEWNSLNDNTKTSTKIPQFKSIFFQNT